MGSISSCMFPVEYIYRPRLQPHLLQDSVNNTLSSKSFDGFIVGLPTLQRHVSTRAFGSHASQLIFSTLASKTIKYSKACNTSTPGRSMVCTFLTCLAKKHQELSWHIGSSGLVVVLLAPWRITQQHAIHARANLRYALMQVQHMQKHATDTRILFNMKKAHWLA